jgi:hypothetical protein
MRFRTYALTLAAISGAGLAFLAFADTPLPEILLSTDPSAPRTWGGWIAVAVTRVAGAATTACGTALVAWYAVAWWRLRRARRRGRRQRSR